MNVEKVAYGGWPNCYRIVTGETELIVTSDVGPRVIRYGFIGGQNMFYEAADQLGKSGEPYWMPRGGHRLWVAPETDETYALDNEPVSVTALTFVQAGPIEKEISFAEGPDGSVEVRHRIQNCGSEPHSIAPWALSQMAQGGIAIVEFPLRDVKQLQPTNPLAMWSYTDFSDARWRFTHRYICLQQDPQATTEQKVGLFNPNTVAAYRLGADVFVKRYTADPAAVYPDFGSSFEMYTNRDFLELETLGPLTDLAPGESAFHVENWTLQRDILEFAV